MTWRILITCPPMLASIESCQERFKTENLEVVTPEIVQQLSEDELCQIIAEFDGVIAGDDPFTAKVLEIGQKGQLKVLAKWGIGVDAIDLEAAKNLGIYTSNTPNVFGDEVADVALGYTLLLARQLHKIDSAIRQGNWLKIQGTSLRNKVAGIIGVGSIGAAIARRFKVMGMNLLGYDVRTIDPKLCQETQLKQVELHQLFQASDCIVLACNLTPENYHLLDEKAFNQMKNGTWIVNVARGPIIDEKALINALDSGRIAGAALDVFESEPITTENPLVKYEQVIMGSHNSSNTREAVLRVNQIAIDNLVRDLKRASGENQ
ncbi:D-isomer specific 2-hydroxyacid dehydrogenase NAD-binding [Rippkaea orientalis PCC 8801]|uniref:D-isomer specific 2-hydroxyacid dehydrogenase NAD-binding n=1 Tax=Rippkaea orientalis (strain PCC 8801 / RF-1) TaxID=41431 RepID=B7JZK0_RIPO1|nr:phosphoglycerate dehydrogenase [Rippkaea orientalis]ACK64160.1 D-isomer specific 2-hydroxyacid dehydrogenase NAD-binding [Rippkaea orientalis PCC 8801]